MNSIKLDDSENSEEEVAGFEDDSPLTNDSFFPHNILLQRLDLLKYLTQCSDLVILMSGVQGSGKTRLLHEFLSIKQESWHLCAMQADAAMEAAALPNQIFQGFGLDEDATLLDFGDYLEDLENVGQLALLVIDDAQDLSIDALLAVLCIPQEAGVSGKSLRILLFAEPVIEGALKGFEASLGARVLQRMDMPRYSLDDTKAYIEHRYPAADLSEESCSEIFRKSEGVPGSIQYYVTQQLEKKIAAPKVPEPAPAVKKPAAKVEPTVEEGIEPEGWEEDVIESLHAERLSKPAAAPKSRWVSYLAGGVGVTLALLALWFQDGINRLFLSGSENAEDTAVGERIPIQLPDRVPMAKVVVEADRPDAAMPATEDAVGQSPELGGERVAPEVASVPSDHPVVAKEQPVPALPEAEQSQVPEVAHQTTPVEANPAALEAGAEPETPLSAAPAKEAKAEQAIEKQVTQVEKTEQAKKVEPTKKIEKKQFPVETKPAPPVAEKVAPEPVAPAKLAPPKPSEEPTQQASSIPGVKSPSWVLQQNSSHYVVQLLGTRKPDTIAGFVRANGLSGEVSYITTQNQGKNWYVLLYGVFPSRQAAVEGIKKLPKQIRAGSVWIRSVASVQQDTHKGN